MTKKEGASKFANSLKRMFKDKSGVLSSIDEKWIEDRIKAHDKYLRAPTTPGPGLGWTDETLIADELKRYEDELRDEKEEANRRAEEAKKPIFGRYADHLEDRTKRAKKWIGKHPKGIVRIGRGIKKPIGDVGARAKEIMRGKLLEGDEESGRMFILMAAMLYFIDKFLGFNGINIGKFMDNFYFTNMESYVGWFFNSIVLTLLIAYWVLYRPNTKEFISWFLVAEALSLIIFLGGMGTQLIHLAFVLGFYFLYIRYSGEKVGGTTGANYTFLALLLFDFFGFGLLAEFVDNPFVSNRLIIPIWFYFALIYSHRQKRTFGMSMLIFIVIMMNVFYFVGGLDGLKNMGATLTDEQRQEGSNFITVGLNNVLDTFKKAWEGFQADLDAQLVHATGGYYKGEVEKNKDGPLGVFIEKLQTSQPRYYEGEEVIVFGSVKARSLEEGVNVDMKCYKEGFIFDTDSTTVIPNKTFTVYSSETRDFECSFKPKKMLIDLTEIREDARFFDLGINTITVDAEFSFETLAYLKSYFMDIDKKRDMTKEGLDPFREYGIKDKEPIAIYTDGPVIIGMETTSPIIEVGDDVVSRPRLGITLENRDGWEGVIRSLTELVILTPPGALIENLEDDCTVEFKVYTKDDCKGKSCKNLAFDPCVSVCKANKKPNVPKDCDKECSSVLESCEKDCEILFEGEEGEGDYNGYTIDVDAEDWLVFDKFKDIDRYRSFSCRLKVEPKILRKTPFTLRYFRAKARYDYAVSKDIDVQVQSEPGTVKGSKITELDEIRVDKTRWLIYKTIAGKVSDIAKQEGVDEDLALALVYVESRFRHCCEEGSGTGDNCKTTDADTCSKEYLITSGDKSSIGVMQVNINDADYISRVCGMGISDMYNLEKNIKCGLNILKDKYESYKSGFSEDYFKDLDNNVCHDPRYIKDYASYREWNAALRGYNGWGCGTGADVNFVESVRSAESKISS